MSEIVVGVDASAGAAEALRWAAEEAELRGARLVAVLGRGFVYPDALLPTGPTASDFDETDALAALAAILAGTLGDERAATVERRTILDLPGPGLVDESEGADLLVVGARGMGGFRELLLGSVGRYCLHHAAVPTVVVRHRQPVTGGHLVVGVDGSDGSRRALEWAVKEAALRGARLTVAHAYQPPYVGGYPYAGADFDPGLLAQAGEKLVSRMLAAADVGDVVVDHVVTCGTPAEVLLGTGTDADLVVVGARGHRVLKRLVLGSVASQVAHHAPCPVAVVP